MSKTHKLASVSSSGGLLGAIAEYEGLLHELEDPALNTPRVYFFVKNGRCRVRLMRLDGSVSCEYVIMDNGLSTTDVAALLLEGQPPTEVNFFVVSPAHVKTCRERE